MSLPKLFLTLFILTSSLLICFGQETNEVIEGDNWVNQTGLYPNSFISLRYDRYSKADIVKFREKIDLLKTAKFSDEWEGKYLDELSQLSATELWLDSNVGFIDYYIYTCFPELRRINYGKVVNTPEYIQVIPEFADESPRKAKINKFIKVKWDERHYLVEESALLAFSEKAVGIYVEPARESLEEGQKWMNYWVKGDLEKELEGLPELPSSYKSFQRFPIEVQVVSVGKRTFEEEKSINHKYGERIYYDIAVYPITINAGRNKEIKKGMSFFTAQTNDEFYITEVKENTAIGFVIRDTDDNKNDVCYQTENAEEIDCPKLNTQIKIKTRVGDFSY